MNPFFIRGVAFAMSLSSVVFASGKEFDLLIREGRIVDGTGNPWFYGDVGVKKDRIVAVGNLPRDAGREINARGLVVCPGFIDMHSHSDWVLLEDGRAQSKIRQGVTTEIIGEGFSAGPWKGRLAPREVSAGSRSIRIATLSDYFHAVESAGISLNVASYVGIGNLWQSVMGHSFEPPNRAQLEEMKALLNEAMEQGALGLSTALMMPPGSLASLEQLVEFCEVVARHGGIYSTHVHDEGLGIFESINKAIEIGERAGVPVDVLHLKIADQRYWGRMNEVLALFDSARSRGVNIQANIYPYTRGNNDLASIIPPWAHEGGRDRLLERLKNPELRPRIKNDIRNGLPGWYNHYTAVGGDWRRMLISADNPEKGKTMDQVIAARSAGQSPAPDPLDILIDFLIEQRGSVSTVYAHHTEDDMNLALSRPWCSVGSDGSALAVEGPLRRGNPHPRNFGTFPRVLGVYVREKGLLRLEDAIRKMTSLNAAKVGLRERGCLRAGCFADITIFDASRVMDRSTYSDPFQYGEGIEFVIVNGELVLEKGRHTGARPGRALRRENSSPGDSPFARGASAKKLAVQGAGEGPAWHAPSKSLFFSGGNRITRFDPATGKSEVFREPSGGSNGLLFDQEGRLVACEAGNRRVTRTEHDGRITVLAGEFEGKRFNSPNDLTIDSKGRIYFSDPRYGNRQNMELRVEGVYRIDAPGLVHRVLGEEVDRPNGVLVSPDDRYLFVADNHNDSAGGARKLWRFALKGDGSVVRGSRKLLFDFKTSRGPDGIKVDARNRLFVAAGLNRAHPPHETAEPYKGGIYVFSFDGELIDFLAVPNDEVTNCAFGGGDLKTLFITAGSELWSIRVDAPGRVSLAK